MRLSIFSLAWRRSRRTVSVRRGRYAYNPEGEWTYQHLMSVNGKFSEISQDDLMEVANRFGVGTSPRVLRTVAEAVSSWPDFARAAAVSDVEATRVREHQRPLVH